jgi:plastocyanin
MSIMGHQITPGALIASVLLLIVSAGALMPVFGLWQPGAGAPVREIRLVTRAMAFYLESDPATPNPVITVKAGERVRIVLNNLDRGMTHDFAVPALGTALKAIDWNENGVVDIDVPEQPGTYEYICRPHAAMMRGTIIIGDL